jgi:hypothetical protein
MMRKYKLGVLLMVFKRSICPFGDYFITLAEKSNETSHREHQEIS